MFDNKLFEDWLDNQATQAMDKITKSEPVSQNEMMVLVLKAQTNHIAHMEQDIRGEMMKLGEDLRREMLILRQDMDKRFEQVDKRFEQVDKRFEQVDKRFEVLTTRIDSFMRWSFSTTILTGGFVITVIQLLK